MTSQADLDGFRCEAAWDVGAVTDDDCEIYTFTEAQLIAFAKKCEQKGRAETVKLIEHWGGSTVAAYLDRFVDATDEEIEAELAK